MKGKRKGLTSRRKLREFPESEQPHQAIMEYEKYRTVVEKAADFIYLMDRNNKILSVNKSAATLLGRTPKEIEGKSIFDLFPKKVATAYSQHLAEVFKTGKGRLDSDSRMVVGGQEFWISAHLDPITDSEGNVLAVLGVSRDITERKLMEEALRRQTDLLLGVFNNAKGAIFILDAQNPPRILDCNQAASDIFSYPKSEMLGKTTAFLHVNNESLKQFQSQLYSAMKRGLPFQLQEFKMNRKDGSVFPSEHSVSQLLNDKGERTGWVSVVRDVTERKRFEEELRALALFPSENPNPVLRLDKRGTILSANEASNALLQEWGSRIGKTAPKPWRDLVTPALSTGEDRNIDVELGGKSYTFLVKPITGAGYVNLYGRDITDRKRMEAQLAYQANLLANVNDAVVASDENFNITSWNRAAERIYGWKADEVLGRKGPELLQTEFIDAEKSEVYRQLAETGEWRGELIHRAKNGKPIHMESASIALRDEGGRITGYVAVNRDITERKRIEEVLRESEEKYRALVESSPDLVGIIQDGALKYVNEAASKKLGWSIEEILSFSDPIGKLIATEYTGLTKENMGKRLRGEEVAPYEISLVTKNGSQIPVLVHGARITYKGRPADEFLFVDISERKRAENERREVEGKLLALHRHALQLRSARNIDEIVNSTLDAIEFALGFDVADFYIVAGNSLRVIGARGAPIGLSEEHLNGRGLVAKAARSQATIRVSDTRKEPDYVDRKGWDWTGPHTTLSELTIPVVVNAETVAVLNAESIRLDAFSSEDQRLLETLAAHVGSEIQRLKHAQELETYSKHLEMLVEERTKKLGQMERLAAIGETAAMVGHDLRNPLQGITGALHLLRQESLTEKERNEMLQLIQDNVEYADAIVRDLSDFSAEIHLELVEATPKSITREAIQAFKVPGKITVQDFSEDHTTLRVDPERMRRVFINLIENAIDAMPQGGTLTISSKQSGGDVEIALSDTGSGFPEKVMQNLWKPLQTMKAKGLGLGLAICKRIVDAHGGTISVKSKAGEGTSVTIRLPIKPEPVEVKQK